MPMVVSGVLADQVGWGLHDGLRSGRDARQFADAVVDLLIDDDDWRVTRETLLETAAREFDPDAYRSTVLDALGLGANHRSETEGW